MGGSNRQIVDAIGQIGFDPENQWGSGHPSTQNNTLRRKSEVSRGDINAVNQLDPKQEGDGYDNDTMNDLSFYKDNSTKNVLINEVLASYSGADNTEFVGLSGPPNYNLAGLSLLVIKGDAEGS